MMEPANIQSDLMACTSSELTSNLRHQIHLVDVLAAYGAAIGSLYPRFEAFVVQIMPTG